MAYKPTRPNQLGISSLKNIEVRQLVNYIDWKFFFRTWRLLGDYSFLISNKLTKGQWLCRFDDLEQERANQVFDLWNDAQSLLNELIAKKSLQVNATFGLFEAMSDGENIIVKSEENVILPMFRQQYLDDAEYCLSLADFVAQEDDYIGLFAVVVHSEAVVADEYKSLLKQSLLDRLAEATTEWLHEQIRKKYWGFAAKEVLTIEEMKQSRFQGIRPAVGYPSLPDQSLIFKIGEILPLQEIGIELTENGAMMPSSSICGMVFAHPNSRYFRIGRISKTQFKDYATRRGISCEELERFVGLEIVE